MVWHGDQLNTLMCVLPCSTGSCSNVWIGTDSARECAEISAALGCGGCKDPSVGRAMLAVLNRTGSVTLCPPEIMHADGPYACAAPYGGMWCEQALTAGTWLHQSQPVNVLTSLAGSGLGLYGLRSSQTQRLSGYHRACCLLMVCAGMGSALCHGLPLLPWTHAADWVPMLALVAASMAYSLHVAAHSMLRLSPRAASNVADGILAFGLAFGAFAMVAYHVGRLGVLTYKAAMIIGSATQALAHAAIACGLAVRRAQCGVNDVSTIVRAYALALVASAAAVPAQRIEYGGCPGWLLHARLNAHAIWHLGIFYALHNCLTVLLLLEMAGQATGRGACSCAPWLLIKVVADRGDASQHHRAENTAEGPGVVELAASPRQPPPYAAAAKALERAGLVV